MHHKLKTWLLRIDQLYIFTPDRWPHREVIGRATALIIITAFLALRLYQFHRFPGTLSGARSFYGAFTSVAGVPLYTAFQITLLWALKLAVWSIETFIYLGYIASYASRAKVLAIASGFMETAFPVIVAGTPIVISLMPYGLPRWVPYTAPEHMAFYMGIMTLIVSGGLLNLIGLLTLRRAFTIMAEARTLITTGVFRYVRHPLYTGHFIMFFGSLLLRLSWASVILYLLFVAGQIVRAKVEERKLMGAFPNYADYRAHTGMLFPKPSRPGPAGSSTPSSGRRF
jgi:protein-S-isoprenylcysteine O-methyltransferase Ste14